MSAFDIAGAVVWTGLAEALAELDAIDCPVAKAAFSGGSCPKCGAEADQNCGRWVTQVSILEDCVRQALASYHAQETKR